MEPSESTKYKPGDSLTCRIESPEPGGYLVTLLPTGVQGFLPSEDQLKLGTVVPTTFICMNQDKALLSYAFMIGTTERIQFSTASDSENAFAIWVDSHPKSERLKRAVDLIMPPVASLSTVKRIAMDEADKFVMKLENEAFTGCVKVDSESRPSRSAALFYRGRAVGGIYTKKELKEPYPIEASLMLMMEDMRKSETEVEYYTLPEEFVLALSALFLGVAIEKQSDATNEQHTEKLLKQFKERKSTACLSIHQSTPSALVLFCRGKFEGAYSIEDRQYSPDHSFLKNLLTRFSTAQLVAFLLPEAIVSESVSFGYRLMQEPFTAAS